MAGIEGFEPIQPTVLETAALPIELYPYGGGSRIRTGDAGVKVPCLNHLTIPRYIYSPKKNVNAAAAITQPVKNHSSLVMSEMIDRQIFIFLRLLSSFLDTFITRIGASNIKAGAAFAIPLLRLWIIMLPDDIGLSNG